MKGNVVLVAGNNSNELPVEVIEIQDIKLSYEDENLYIFAKSKVTSLTRRAWKDLRDKAVGKGNINHPNVLMIAGNIVSGEVSGADHKEIFENFKEHDTGKSRY